MGVKIIIGDITEASEDIILHQVNCQNVMGSGVAKALYTKWPQVKSEYHDYCDMFKCAEDRLGNICVVAVSEKQLVINCFSQLTFGTTGKHTNYLAVARCFEYVNRKSTVAIPYLYGCGLGGGDWNVVSALIEEAFGDRAVIYKLPVS